MNKLEIFVIFIFFVCSSSAFAQSASSASSGAAATANPVQSQSSWNTNSSNAGAVSSANPVQNTNVGVNSTNNAEGTGIGLGGKGGNADVETDVRNDADSVSESIGIQELHIGGGEVERPLYPAPLPGHPAPGAVFVDPGRSINAGTAKQYLRLGDYCFNDMPLGLLEETKGFVDMDEDINVAFVPCKAYATEAPRSFVRSVKVGDPDDGLVCGRYHLVGHIILVTDNEEETAQMIGSGRLDRKALEVLRDRVSGFSYLKLIRSGDSTTYEREQRTQGRGASIGPGITGYLGEVLAALGSSFGLSETEAGMFQRAGVGMLVIAPAAPYDQDAFAVTVSNGKMVIVPATRAPRLSCSQ